MEEAPVAVQGAIASLSGTFGGDVLHPSDKKDAVNAFKALSRRGVPIDPTLVRSLAVRSGWEPEAADRLAEIAGRISEGRIVRGGDRLNQIAAKKLVARFETVGD